MEGKEATIAKRVTKDALTKLLLGSKQPSDIYYAKLCGVAVVDGGILDGWYLK